MKPKLYIYGNAQDHVHDSMEFYKNTVPMSLKGIDDHFELCGPNVADYFYMGQVGDGHPDTQRDQWEFFEKYTDRHIADIEGDWLGKEVPDFFEECITTRNGILESDMTPQVCVRPTFSVLLVKLGRDPIPCEFERPKEHGFSFKGLPDPFNVRLHMYHAWELANLPGDLSFNKEFLAPIAIHDPRRTEYIELMKKYSLALCPRGAGLDSVRYLEACALGRCPIIVGEHAVVGEDLYDTSFMFRISDRLTPISMARELSEIFHNTDETEAIKRGMDAQNYFQTIIKSYFSDPTKYLLDFLERRKL